MDKDKMNLLQELFSESEAVLVGAGSGMSSSAGYNHYHYVPFFQEHFTDFEEAYGIRSLFQGFYHVYSTPEEQWGFFARYIKAMYEAPAGSAYQNLANILGDKPYFILTTNCDIQLPKVFPEEKIFSFQGDFRYFQCRQPCHDRVYENKEMIDDMVRNMNGLAVPEEWIPRCPECGWRMVPWVQDDTFLHGQLWEQQRNRYEQFLTEYGHKKLLLLELGVGEMTPSVIKFPFWQMAEKNPDTFLVSVNREAGNTPEFLTDKSMEFQMDLKEFSEYWK